MSVEHMLTTEDNPFNPFTQWESWFAWDRAAGYNTPSYLARVVATSYDLSENDQNTAIEDAMDEIVKENILGIYKKVSETSYS